MSADDLDALWASDQCPSGRDDLPAWKRPLTALEFRDPRRSLAAAQVQSLRAEYAIVLTADARRGTSGGGATALGGHRPRR